MTYECVSDYFDYSRENLIAYARARKARSDKLHARAEANKKHELAMMHFRSASRWASIIRQLEMAA